jgi:hypothetical protein
VALGSRPSLDTAKPSAIEGPIFVRCLSNFHCQQSTEPYTHNRGHFTGPDAEVHTAGAKIIGVAAEGHAGILTPTAPSHNQYL